MGIAMKTALSSEINPSLAKLASSAQQASFFKLGLLGSDGPNQDSKDSFGYDIRDRVSDLLPSCCRHTGDPEHLDDVHEGIGQPRDNGQPSSVPCEGSD